jgi:hypothetical protein
MGQSNISVTACILRDIHIKLRNIMNMNKSIIAVIGATGRQGGGMIDALFKDGTFAVRAITRDSDSDKAKGKSTNPPKCINNLPKIYFSSSTRSPRSRSHRCRS